MENLLKPHNWLSELENEKVYSIGNDLILFDTPLGTSAFSNPVKLDVVVAVICIKGSVKGTVNLRQFCAESPCLFIVLTGQILQCESFSEDFSGHFIVMSKLFLENLLVNSHIGLPLFFSVHENPWTPLTVEELVSMTDYYTMLQKAVSNKDNPHRIDIVKHLTLAFFFGFSYQYHKIPDITTKSKHEILVDKFLNCVKANYKVKRGMEFYAGKLCLTPKYLSRVIKETSGKSANEWIDNYVTLEAKELLKSTNMTIQQISDKLNFPSQSFFGKYFKRLAGMSPKEFRKY
jgi:AraC family transcriptional activator of pobA